VSPSGTEYSEFGRTCGGNEVGTPSCSELHGGPPPVADGTYSTGMCLVLPRDFAARARAIACDQPHDAEVYYAGNLPSTGTSTFDDYSTYNYAEETCYTRFGAYVGAYVGVPYEESVFSADYFVPNQDTWAQGERTITCFLFQPGQVFNQSMRGAGR
jgi:hypothetical protein